MPKLKGPGGKNRKKAKGSTLDTGRRELVFAEDGQCYAYVSESKGDGRYAAFCSDNRCRLAVLRGKLWKRCWIRRGDIVLVTLRDYQDARCDIVHKYNCDEITRLTSHGEIAGELAKMYNIGDLETDADAHMEDVFVFEDI
jgi:translation initiation factor 1A